MPHPFHRLAGSTVAVFLLFTAGCSGDQPMDDLDDLHRPGTPPASSASTPGESATPGEEPPSAGEIDPDREPLPIQHYMLVGREYDAVMQALAILSDQCMARQGFDLEIPPPEPARGFMVDISYRRYGPPETLEDALEVGYGLPARAGGEASAPEPEEPLSDAAEEALRGTQEEWMEAIREGRRAGCFGEADRALMGEASMIEASGLAQPPLIREINQDPRSADSPASREATKVFAQCMSEAGYPNVVAPLGERPEQFGAGDIQQPSEAEKQSAVAKFYCFEESGVREEMRAAEVAFQLAAIEANPEAFAQIRQELDEVVRRATVIVAERGEN